tara:strand:- start:3388 stop:3807 length:420 start_codon:yes stop_codon:yes gene_type:complete
MEDFYQYSYSLAATIWGAVTVNQEQEVSITISNEVGDEIFIKSAYRYNGINCNIQVISDGLIINDKNMIGGSYEALQEFLIDNLDVENKTGRNNDNSDDNSLKVYSNSVMSFAEFLEDLEIEQILVDDPDIALHEMKVA